MFKCGQLTLQRGDVSLGLSPKIGIVQKRLVPLNVRQGLLVGGKGTLKPLQKSMVAKRLAVAFRIRQNDWVAQSAFHALQTTQYASDLTCVDQGLAPDWRQNRQADFYFANFA